MATREVGVPPEVGAQVPRQGGALLAGFGRLLMRLLGWRFDGEFPDVARCVLIVAPHTSNWDFVVGLAALFALRLRASWLGKHTIFRRPFGMLWRRLGGIPVDRSQAERVVDSTVASFREREQLWLGLAPEGTRRRVEHWKSGFHRIARGARVPILPVAFDYSRRAIVLFPLFVPGDDYEADVAALGRLFRPEMARRPANYGAAPAAAPPPAT